MSSSAAKKMFSWIGVLAVKARRPNFRFSATTERLGVAAFASNPGTGRRKRQILGACWLASLDKTVTFRFSERSCVKNKGDECAAHGHTQARTPTPTVC